MVVWIAVKARARSGWTLGGAVGEAGGGVLCMLFSYAQTWLLVMPKYSGALLGQGVGEGAGWHGIAGDGMVGLPLRVEMGEGFFAACDRIALGDPGVEGPGVGVAPEAVRFCPVVGMGWLAGLSEVRLKPREIADDMKNWEFLFLTAMAISIS